MKHSPMAHFPEADYQAIESALLGTSKGQWFLREFLDRNKGAETLSMLHAVTRLHRVLVGEEAGRGQQVARDVKALIEDIRRTRRLSAGMDDAGRVRHLLDLADHMEAQLMAMDEDLEDPSPESRFITLAERLALAAPGHQPADRAAKLYGELSAMVRADETGPAYDC